MVFYYLKNLQEHSGIFPPYTSKPDSIRPPLEMLEDSHRDNSKKIKIKKNELIRTKILQNHLLTKLLK